MQECDKIRDRVMPFLENKAVLDLGCGDRKVVPWAVGVDDGSEWGDGAFRKSGPDLVWGIAPHERLREALREKYPVEYDVVFSSHALEHMRTPILETLRYWMTFVAEGGVFIGYLPDERHYLYDPGNPKARNPAHHHYLTADTFRWYLDQVSRIKDYRIEMRTGNDEYSFLVIAQL